MCGVEIMKHKRQHYIPQCYLSSWCDPNTPEGHTPYVWLFDKNDNSVKKKAPKKIFHEKDMYTVYAEDGTRDLKFEYNLSRLESEFTQLRQTKLDKGIPLSYEEKFLLCMFAATMHGRTKSYANHHGSQWKKVLDMAEKMREKVSSASPSERAKMPKISDDSSSGNSFTIEEARKFAENPITSTLSAIVRQVSPMLFKMPFLIIIIPERFRFITSDAPCVWFDPALFQTDKPFGAGGLISPTIEITLPLSPQQMLLFANSLEWEGFYLPLMDEQIIDNWNKRTIAFSHEYFVSNQPNTKPTWL